MPESLPVALLTPTGKDGIIAERVLKSAGLIPRLCADMNAVCELLGRDEIGVFVMAEEALGGEAKQKLFDALQNQASWSDVPVIILTGEDELSGHLPKVLSGIAVKGNVTLLERPVRVATLTTVIRSGLRARQRQLDVRDHLAERTAAERSLRESEARLRSAVQSAPYPLMLHAEDGEILQLSQAWTALTGYDAAELVTTAEWSKRALSDAPDGKDLLSSHDTELDAGGSVELGERQVKIADGTERTWDFHRVALGSLPDGRRLTLTAAVDVTEYRELVERERSARAEAEGANAAKSRFLATMSHELRTPLNAIQGYTQLLALEVRGPITPPQREDLERIERSQRHLLSLINDVLNFAKIEAGHIAVVSEPVDLAEVFASIREFVELQLQEKSIQFTLSHTVPGELVCGDGDKVRQVLINLLSNAIKFTPRGGLIELKCVADDEMFHISVRDTGTGIPPDKLEAIFEPFVQVSRDYSSKHQGTGLGLSISR
ncbi:MAG TPA: histidine kinase dimerization/phospho-acceptor domain-containing protein, partial [Gemmatimonadaceae bacterium]|nr:histidine kinase dimerization/phospho-acceptor domain-containing protein [Gemmatimonadaceae bacterium]